MGRLPDAPPEARLAATLFLLLLGIADLFGAWQVRNFAAFTPAGVAASVSSGENHGSAPDHHGSAPGVERPVDLALLDQPRHTIDRQLLVQDTHVHVPAYAMTAALLSLIVLGLRLSSVARCALVLSLFAAPLFDFAGLWGAHLAQSGRRSWAVLSLAGGFLMGVAYLLVLLLCLFQCWFSRKGAIHA